jgi:hypothetical protein
MQRIVAELFAESLEGLVIGGTPVSQTSTDFDLECEFIVRCDDGARFRVPGWAVDITVLES